MKLKFEQLVYQQLCIHNVQATFSGIKRGGRTLQESKANCQQPIKRWKFFVGESCFGEDSVETASHTTSFTGSSLKVLPSPRVLVEHCIQLLERLLQQHATITGGELKHFPPKRRALPPPQPVLNVRQNGMVSGNLDFT